MVDRESAGPAKLDRLRLRQMNDMVKDFLTGRVIHSLSPKLTIN
jgi:hypothetical protein